MATQSRSLRRGLPRVPGGAPWPPAGQAPVRFSAPSAAAPGAAPGAGPGAAPGATAVTAPAAAVPSPGLPAAIASKADVPGGKPAAGARQLRRGQPRVPGGEPWPPAGVVPVRAVSAVPAATAVPAPAAEAAPAISAPAAPAAIETEPAAPSSTAVPGTTPLRRGLPRVPGGEPWPPAGFAPAPAPASAPAASLAEAVPEAASAPALPAHVPAAPADSAPAVPAAQAAPPVPAAVAPAAPAEKPVTAKTGARLYGSRTKGQWVTRVVLLAVGAVVAAGILVLAARGLTTLPGVPAFLKRYPGTYELPDAAEPGFPWWAQWQHFLNIFLMVLIIRSGYQVRSQQKPPAYWTPKNGGKKISITLWLHQSLDFVWLANGLLFAVLLFASGHWMRIVPTSWEVFPNAVSALLQYLMLDWPVETGWVNYNSLQQLMYFIVVFVAAPLAAATGARMSELWPKNAKTLNRLYPVEAARALHFPTMLFFVLFILIHVFLVFATGALRNLNHMFAGTDEVNWVGFWLFAAAIAITAAGWFAARPIVLAPLARLFGKVSSR